MNDRGSAPEGGEPSPWEEVRGSWLAHRPWLDRAIVLGYAAVTGAAVVAFTLLSEAASHGHESLRVAGSWGPWAALAGTPVLTVLLLWWTRRYAPGAAGSGIPQVMRALDDAVPDAQRAGLVSWRLSLHKMVLVSGGTLAGLSIGREGPTVQVGAGIMAHARRWLSPGSGVDAHDLMVAGAAAGIAAAFNTPLGGIVFAIEQLTRRRGSTHSALVIASIVLAGVIAIAVFGNETYFGRLPVQSLSWALLAPGIAVALATGLAGGLFVRLIIASSSGLPGPMQAWRTDHPYRFAFVCALGVAVIGWATAGQTAGAGYATTRALLEGQSDLPVIYTVLKFCATWLSAWTGVPAGMFAPSLAIGAGIGHDVASATGAAPDVSVALIALGMVGFLAATTQGPITAFIIVMEMVAGQAMVLSLMACAMVASGISRLISKPMYTELAVRLVVPMPPASEPARPPHAL